MSNHFFTLHFPTFTVVITKTLPFFVETNHSKLPATCPFLDLLTMRKFVTPVSGSTRMVDSPNP